MQPDKVPPYKPTPELQEQIYKNAKARDQRASYLPKRSWVQRNPRLFQATILTSCLLILFSKPLYDAFLVPTSAIPKKAPPAHQR